jgi:hypothetical protein
MYHHSLPDVGSESVYRHNLPDVGSENVCIIIAYQTLVLRVCVLSQLTRRWF